MTRVSRQLFLTRPRLGLGLSNCLRCVCQCVRIVCFFTQLFSQIGDGVINSRFCVLKIFQCLRLIGSRCLRLIRSQILLGLGNVSVCRR